MGQRLIYTFCRRALLLNTRVRAGLELELALVVYTQLIALLQASTDTVHLPSVALGT